MKTILIAEGDDRLAELFADLFTLEGLDRLPPTMPASARLTRSLAVLRTTRCL
jgi:hypothetical protein